MKTFNQKYYKYVTKTVERYRRRKFLEAKKGFKKIDMMQLYKVVNESKKRTGWLAGKVIWPDGTVKIYHLNVYGKNTASYPIAMTADVGTFAEHDLRFEYYKLLKPLNKKDFGRR